MENNNNMKNNNVRRIPTKGTKNMNVKMNKGGFVEGVKEFMEKDIRKYIIIFGVISVVLFVLSFFSVISGYNNGEIELPTEVMSFSNQIIQLAIIEVLILIIGITPVVPIPVLGVIQMTAITQDMILRHILGLSLYPTLFLGGLVQAVSVALYTAAGFYHWKLANVKNKFDNKTSDFTFRDVRIAYYEAKKDNQKAEELKQKKVQEKIDNQKYNIDIPYLKILSVGMLSFVIGVVGIIITKI